MFRETFSGAFLVCAIWQTTCKQLPPRARRAYPAMHVQELLLERAPRSGNVLRIYAQTSFVSLAFGLWQGYLLSQYLYALTPDTRTVGVAMGAQGIVRVFAAVAAGLLVDRCVQRRNTLLVVCAAYGLAWHAWIATLIVAPDFVLPQAWRHGWQADAVWAASLAGYGSFDALQQVLTDAVFADSVATGARAGPYTRRQLIRQCAGLASPLLQLAYFALVPNANHWTEATLRPAMLAGIGAGAVSCLLVASLDQSRTLGLASEAAHVASASPPLAVVAEAVSDAMAQPLVAVPSAATAAATGAEEERRRFYDAMRQAGATVPVLKLVEASEAAQSRSPPVETAASATRVRWLILLYDLLRVCSGGLVIKFVGLFFTNTFGVSPVSLALLQLGCTLSMLSLTIVAGRLAGRGLRRGAICLALLVICDAANILVATAPSLAVDITAWIVREGSLNAVFGLKKSLMMDHTPKDRRGRWNAVDSLQSSVWAGTAAAGGFLIHAYGYRAALAVMSGGFICATIAFAPLANKR